jgi:hypothetical protein
MKYFISLLFLFLFVLAAYGDGSISGRLLKSDGRPRAYTEIEIVPLSADDQVPNAHFSATSSTSGAFEFSSVPAGECTLSINFKEKPSELSPYSTLFYPNTTSRPLAKVFTIGPETRVSGIIFKLVPALKARTITGVVVDGKGSAVPDAFLGLRDMDADPALTSFGSLRTDARGHFSINAFETRQYRIYAILFDRLTPPSDGSPFGKIIARGMSETTVVGAMAIDLKIIVRELKERGGELDRDVGIVIRR